MPVILASSSPRRAKLLKQIGLQFEISPSTIEEVIIEGEPPVKTCTRIAESKACDVSTKHNNSIIIAADTIVVQNGRIIGKPSSKNDAREILSSLSGTEHMVLTGVCLIKTGNDHQIIESDTFHQITSVTFTELSMEEIDSYIESSAPFDKAGAYGIQDDLGSLFVKSITGDYYNVVGFPLQMFYEKLKKFEPALAAKILN